MNPKLSFYLVAMAIYPLLVYVVVEFLVRQMDFSGTDAAGAGMARAFSYIYGCIFACAIWFIISFFVARFWAGSAWHAIPAGVGGLLILWMISIIPSLIEQNRIESYTEYYYGTEIPCESGKRKGGERHGEITFYREEDGSVERIEKWRRGQPHGLQRTFYPNGNVESEGDVYSLWEEGVPAGDFQKGKWRFYREDGALDDERTYKRSVPVASQNYRYYWLRDEVGEGRTLCQIGSQTPFTGQLECQAVVGKEILPTYYTCRITEGVIDGEWSAYFPFEDRRLAGCGTIIGGRSEGAYTSYYPNGQIRSARIYRKGELEGEYVSYYADSVAVEPHGKVDYRCNYRDGKRDGVASWYREDGSLDETVEYVAGQRHGLSCTYDEQGKLLEQTRYRYDEVASE